MIKYLAKGLTKIFGTKSEKDLKTLLPLVKSINAEFDQLKSISDDELRHQTQLLKNDIATRLADIDSKIAELHAKIENDTSLDIHQKEAIFDQIDKFEKDRNEKLERVLMDILPRAFAVVKETCRRLSHNKELVVTATAHDHEIALIKQNVIIDNNQATWKNRWIAAGTEIEWNMVQYDVQLIGGIVLHQGKISEMATGEGKTLVGVAPAYLNALAGRGVHVVTVNDYLAKRDSEWNAPIFEFHGLKVDCIDKHKPNTNERRQAYNSDITYGTNNEFGFDYLRDNMATNPEELVQRKHHFAMVDEVDSVLIDEARTPLIISGPVPKGGDQHEYDDLKPRIARIVEEQRKLANNFLNDAKKLLAEKNEKDGMLALFRAHRALPKNKPLIKFLSEVGVKQLLQKADSTYFGENQRLLPEADRPLLFTIDEKHNSVELTDQGIQFITEGLDDKFFILPILSVELDLVDKDTSLSLEEKAAAKEKITLDFQTKSQRIHTVNQLLKAYTLFEKDVEYIVVENQVKIVDEQTGRVMDGRRYSDGLHQALEAKENVKIEDATQTYATVTLQNYFRMYHKLCGMTGTAETEAGEFWEIYKLDVVVIPTNRPISRDDRQDVVYRSVREKFNAVIEETIKLSESGRPVLIGTTSVEISELLSRALKMRNMKHNVLNAKQHAREADIVAEAGKAGAITIATNMAGRGTDIKLSPESKAAGGLAIIGTERHESRRVDRQLRGRAGRQGDPGSSQFFVSLEDNLMRLFGSERIAKVMDRIGFEEGEALQHSMVTNSIERAQKKVEENNFSIRKRLLEYDNVMNSQREVIYKRRRNALFGERLSLDILSSLHSVSENLIHNYKNTHNYEGFRISVLTTFGFETKISETEIKNGKVVELSDKLFEEVATLYQAKNEKLIQDVFPVMQKINADSQGRVENVVMDFTDGRFVYRIPVGMKKILESNGKEVYKKLQKTVALQIIDEEWKEHLREMDDLKQAVRNVSYEQKDPLLKYKFEGFELFKDLIGKIDVEQSQFLLKCYLPEPEPEKMQQAPIPVQQAPKTVESKANFYGDDEPELVEEEEKQMPIIAQRVPGRNDRVTVRYADGTIKSDVKFKSVEEDVLQNRAELIEF